MGILSALFSNSDERYPRLDGTHPAWEQLRLVSTPLALLARRTPGRLEVVPREGGAYVFVGRPPKRFSLMWLEAGEVKDLKHYTAEKKLDARRAADLVAGLSEAYQRSTREQRYRASVGGCNVVVAPSAELARELRLVLERGARG